MGHMRSEMVGIPSRKCQWAQNTSYYGLQVVHCVRRSHQYRISSKMTKYTLRAVACSSPLINLLINLLPPNLPGTFASRACTFPGLVFLQMVIKAGQIFVGGKHGREDGCG